MKRDFAYFALANIRYMQEVCTWKFVCIHTYTRLKFLNWGEVKLDIPPIYTIPFKSNSLNLSLDSPNCVSHKVASFSKFPYINILEISLYKHVHGERERERGAPCVRYMWYVNAMHHQQGGIRWEHSNRDWVKLNPFPTYDVWILRNRQRLVSYCIWYFTFYE